MPTHPLLGDSDGQCVRLLQWRATIVANGIPPFHIWNEVTGCIRPCKGVGNREVVGLRVGQPLSTIDLDLVLTVPGLALRAAGAPWV